MEKSRPVRNRRRAWPPGDIHRPVKRLFTPEIKRLLKDWLIRRRDNPYPTRQEKTEISMQTGLTYTQICNWFANWRRKLKNSGKEPAKKTWGHLIKNYNTNAKGNVEQFSICSGDSIWGDNSPRADPDYFDHREESVDENGASSSRSFGQQNDRLSVWGSFVSEEISLGTKAKYKSHIMEKYLHDVESEQNKLAMPELSKWLESTANFTPNKNNYIDWHPEIGRNDKKPKLDGGFDLKCHQKEELDAAEALTSLAGNFRGRKSLHGK
ncbi:homeobox protein Mohawk isoform X2 [Phlebotomus argentipes]|uniref:homeobox protein Mohawk isoform X2 n=1 Tax=Phlebotomus argentipes TaxID=94469 RepID=UPI002892E983|nr:homeobox protein Mohawk isoform X2 [Phlebotomus argentipes]